MALADLLAEGALGIARAAIRAGQIAPNIIRSLLGRFAGEPYRSVRALVSRAFQAERVARESAGSDLILKKDVPLFPQPSSAPYRGLGRGCFEARGLYRLPQGPYGPSAPKSIYVNFDRGLTVDQVLQLVRDAVSVSQPFSQTDPRFIGRDDVENIDVELIQIQRRC